MEEGVATAASPALLLAHSTGDRHALESVIGMKWQADRRFQAMPITLEGRSPQGEREALAPADRGYRPRRRGLIASGSNKLPPPGMGPGHGPR